jgi:hypothetical protein
MIGQGSIIVSYLVAESLPLNFLRYNRINKEIKAEDYKKIE